MFYRFKASHKPVRAIQVKVGVAKPDWLVDITFTEKLGSSKSNVFAVINTLNGELKAQKNDWIIKDYYGHYHVFDAERFDEIFELMPNQPKDPDSTDGGLNPSNPGNGNGSGGGGGSGRSSSK